MKAITVKEAGPSSSMQITELQSRSPGANEVLIKQSFAGVNYGDAIRRKRGLFSLNDQGVFIPGFEGFGEVIAVGSEVSNFKIGDRVSYLSEQSGGYSQEILLDQNIVYKVLDGIPEKTAAVMTTVGLTAIRLVEISNISDKSWVLIHGATGGVGLMLIQLCLLKNANVVALVSSESKKSFLKDFGVKEILINEDPTVIDKINSLTDNNGVDVIFDCIGQSVLNINMSTIKKGATILYYGSVSGHPEFPGMKILMNSLKIQGFNVFNFIKESSLWRTSMNNFMQMVLRKDIEIHVESVFKMSEAYKAHDLLENRNSIGKVLIELT